MRKIAWIAGVILVSISVTSCVEKEAVKQPPTENESASIRETEEYIRETTVDSPECKEIEPPETVYVETDAYIFPNSAEDFISYNDMKEKTDEELRLGRNEIYARHGRIFASTDLQEYFSQKTWYKGTIQADQFTDAMLSKMEQNNVAIIRNVEFQRKIAGDRKIYVYRYKRTESSNGDVGVDEWMAGQKIKIQSIDLDHIMLTDYGIVNDKAETYAFTRADTSFDAYIDLGENEPTWCTCTFGPAELSFYADGSDCGFIYSAVK